MSPVGSTQRATGQDAPPKGDSSGGQSRLPAELETASPVESLSHPWLRPGLIERRAYQVNLAVAAYARPTLVVLPTGLGKTVVALLLIADHLKDRPGKRVVLLAPTKPLVDQHARFLRETLALPAGADPEAFVPAFSGSMPPERREEMWHAARVVVATPQVVSNDVLAGRYDLRQVSLVVFDEAHRATGDYPYVWLAERYQRDNPFGNRLGITASPGNSAERILDVCTNLALTGMELRTESDEDVRPYIHELDIEGEKVPLPDGLRHVGDRLREALRARVDALRRLDLLRGVGGIPSRRELLRLAVEIQSRLRGEDPDRRLFEAMSVQAQAMKIAHALELAETQGAEAFISYYERLEQDAGGKGSSRATSLVASDPGVKAAVAAARAVRHEDPKIDRIVDIVRGELAAQEEPRIIIFANYRETCERLTKRLERVPGCRPVRFVGQSSREGDKGLTQKEQHALVESFRAGTHNILIATAVAEEGLDIPKTDLVVFHEPVPSEIRAIQRRGRTGRSRAGRVIILMYAGTRDETYHHAARKREQTMRHELRALKNAVDHGLGKRRQTRLEETRAAAPTAALQPLPPQPSPPEREPAPAARAPPPPEPAPQPSQREGPEAEQTREPGEVVVLVDHRESRSRIVQGLERSGIQVRPVQLTIADYAISDRVVVERKTVEDFLDSLLDGRLFQQARQLVAYPRPILVVEGPGLTTSRNIPRASIYGAIASLSTDFGISVIMVDDPQETVHLLAAMARREQTEPRREAALRPGKVTLSDREQRRYLLEGLPHVSAVLARRLLDHFGSVERVMTATKEELMAVDGIGRKTAEDIRRVVGGMT